MLLLRMTQSDAPIWRCKDHLLLFRYRSLAVKNKWSRSSVFEGSEFWEFLKNSFFWECKIGRFWQLPKTSSQRWWKPKKSEHGRQHLKTGSWWDDETLRTPPLLSKENVWAFYSGYSTTPTSLERCVYNTWLPTDKIRICSFFLSKNSTGFLLISLRLH